MGRSEALNPRRYQADWTPDPARLFVVGGFFIVSSWDASFVFCRGSSSCGGRLRGGSVSWWIRGTTWFRAGALSSSCGGFFGGLLLCRGGSSSGCLPSGRQVAESSGREAYN